MKLDWPGLLKEKLPSGAVRWRVRVAKQPSKRIRLHVEPSHRNFAEHYHAARAGIQLPPEVAPEDLVTRGSIGWLVVKYLAALEKAVTAGLASEATLKQRRHFLEKMREEYGSYTLAIPSSAIVTMRDSRADTPGAADNFVKTVRAMYKWGIEHGLCSTNPATGVGKINRGMGGAKPWTADDLKAYRERHPHGTTAHLALTLFMFTACRIGDAYRLGRGNEIERAGMPWLRWQPAKRGSSLVEIPMLPPLYKATRAATVVAPGPYLLTEHGRPFKTAASFARRFKKWCDQAGLEDRSSHGIRKAAGELLAIEGASQYHIMAIHGHTSAKTSEVYTKGVDRARLAQEAMALLADMEW